MINRIILAILLIAFTSQSKNLVAQSTENRIGVLQTTISDSLIIERANGQKIKVTWPYRKNIQKDVAWEKLLDDFQSDFGKVSNDIPDYEYYRIDYIQKKNLVVNEVIGRQTYTVNEQNGIDYVKSNLCLIKGNRLSITIEFTDHEELLNSSLKEDIQNAAAQVKHKFYVSASTNERHLYDVKQNKILPKPKHTYKFFIPAGIQAGVLRNTPYVEFRPGIGMTISNKAYIAIQYNIMSQYNSELGRTEYDKYIGFSTGTMSHGFRSDLGALIKSGISSDNISAAFRAGINYRTKGGLTIGTHYYISSIEAGFSDFLDFGFSVGYGF